MSIIRKRKILPRQHPRNQAVGSLPPALGARLVRHGPRIHLMTERNEQTLAHSRPPLIALRAAPPASKLVEAKAGEDTARD